MLNTGKQVAKLLHKHRTNRNNEKNNDHEVDEPPGAVHVLPLWVVVILVDHWRSSATVSYTHLDVYKRQVIDGEPYPARVAVHFTCGRIGIIETDAWEECQKLRDRLATEVNALRAS